MTTNGTDRSQRTTQFRQRLGQMVHERRRNQGYTLRALAEKAGVSHTQIPLIERGQDVLLSSAVLTLRALGIDYSRLLLSDLWKKQSIEETPQ